MFSAFVHWPTGMSVGQEKLPMNPQPITEATSWPIAHHAESRVSVHYGVHISSFRTRGVMIKEDGTCEDSGIFSRYNAPEAIVNK